VSNGTPSPARERQNQIGNSDWELEQRADPSLSRGNLHRGSKVQAHDLRKEIHTEAGLLASRKQISESRTEGLGNGVNGRSKTNQANRTRTKPVVTKTREPKLETRSRPKVRQEKHEPIKRENLRS
jgi:hypothetical protein